MPKKSLFISPQRIRLQFFFTDILCRTKEKEMITFGKGNQEWVFSFQFRGFKTTFSRESGYYAKISWHNSKVKG